MRTHLLPVAAFICLAWGCSKPAAHASKAPPAVPAPTSLPAVAVAPAPPRPPVGHLPVLESLDRAHTSRLFPKPSPTLLRCKISSAPTCELGKGPIIKVVLVNTTSQELCLIESLDGSMDGRRWPRCDLGIQRPAGRRPDGGIICGSMAPLQVKDFHAIPAGGEFYPLGNGRDSGKEISLANLRNGKIDAPGVYRIQFHYSTLNKNLGDYVGSEFPFLLKRSEDLAEIHRLFARVPHTQVSSNEIEVTVLPPKGD